MCNMHMHFNRRPKQLSINSLIQAEWVWHIHQQYHVDYHCNTVSHFTPTCLPQNCHIEVSEEESGDSGAESEPDQPVGQVSDTSVGVIGDESGNRVSGREIDAVITQLRKAAEAKANPPRSSTPPSASGQQTFPQEPELQVGQPTDQHRQTKLESTSSVESLSLPTPPESLPPEKQEEYLALRRKLALHEKRIHQLQQSSRSSSVATNNRKGKVKRKGVSVLSDPRVSPSSRAELEKLLRTKPKSRKRLCPTTEARRPRKRPRIEQPLMKAHSRDRVLAVEKERRIKQKHQKEMEESKNSVLEYDQLIRTNKSVVSSLLGSDLLCACR